TASRAGGWWPDFRSARRWTPCVRTESEPAARALFRGARSDPARVAGGRAVHLERALQPAALRERVAAAGAEAAPAGLAPGRRLDRDLALVCRERLRLLVPLVFRVQAGPRDDEGLPAGARAARRRAESLPRGLPPVRRRGGLARGGARALPRAGR